MRDFAHQIVYSAICSFFFGGGVLHLVYSQDAHTDFYAIYVKRRGSVQGRAFWGSQNQKLTFSPLRASASRIGHYGAIQMLYYYYLPQNRHFGALFRRDLEIFARKRL